MQTLAPSLASRRAMPRPMRLAAPVTSTTWFFRSDCMFWLRQAAGQVRPAPEYRGSAAERSRDGSDRSRVHALRRDSGGRHRKHHDAPLRRFDGGEDASAKTIVDMAEEL